MCPPRSHPRNSHRPMKRSSLLRYLRRHGCHLKRKGHSHSLWCNPNTGTVETVHPFRVTFAPHDEENSVFPRRRPSFRHPWRLGASPQSFCWRRAVPPLQAQGEPLAPADQAAFDDLVVGQRMALDDNLFSSFYYVDFVAAGRFRETDSPGIFTGSYTYENTGSDTGTLTFNYDDGDHFTERLNLVFTSTTSGTATATVNGEESPQFNWRLSPIPESEPLRTLYFPDYADGGGWSVQLAASHISTATEDAAVLVTAYDREGQPIPEFFDFDNPFEIPPLGTRVLTSAATYPEREFRRGWIEVKTDTASVSGLLTYRNAVTGGRGQRRTGRAWESFRSVR